MNILSNIWLHPKTSIAGVLIAIVTIAGVLSQQGITLGTAGTGTVVALIAALATGLLGLLAKDPGSVTAPAGSTPAPTPISNSTQKLGVIMLCVILISGMFSSGCSAQTVAKDIVNWTPALQSAVASIDATASILDPVAAPILTAATVGFDAASNLVVAQAKAYLANPTATILQQLQTAVVTFQQQVNAAVLSAARIVNPASQQKVLADLNGVGTVINAILSLVVSISGKATVAQMAARSTVKLARVEPLMNREQSIAILDAHYGSPRWLAEEEYSAGQQQLAQAGF
jgi:hypothetical protein